MICIREQCKLFVNLEHKIQMDRKVKPLQRNYSLIKRSSYDILGI